MSSRLGWWAGGGTHVEVEVLLLDVCLGLLEVAAPTRLHLRAIPPGPCDRQHAHPDGVYDPRWTGVVVIAVFMSSNNNNNNLHPDIDITKDLYKHIGAVIDFRFISSVRRDKDGQHGDFGEGIGARDTFCLRITNVYTTFLVFYS